MKRKRRQDLALLLGGVQLAIVFLGGAAVYCAAAAIARYFLR